ncbi:uncharacterized protein EI90DRAFT_3010816 [Cantharellus anzutake]|uniref:uncharacterized protein n=1 Tax=Cantharellus anzutake TaxID=1750568 RepID=UPI001908E72C|nr:uncharacterized protein EI90DRAFT_3010816 [Cantharellus anzutake]KAF8343986.1 hypothetical protein EI90DRAFT_3010816 [Cantharellus anzutake]
MSNSPEYLTYFVSCPDYGLIGPIGLHLHDVKFDMQIRDQIYEKHPRLHDNFDPTELLLYKPENLTKRGEGQLIDRVMASINGKDPLDEEEEIGDVFGEGFRDQVHVVVKVEHTLPKRRRPPPRDEEPERLKKILRVAPSALSKPSRFKTATGHSTITPFPTETIQG